VTVENDRVVKVRGSRANPLTAGVLCTKVQTLYPDFVHGPGRLMTPLRRVGPKGEGRFERISWAAALDLVHEGHGVVLGRDPALAGVVRDEPVGTDVEAAGALAWGHHRSGAHGRPVEVGRAVHGERLAVGPRQQLSGRTLAAMGQPFHNVGCFPGTFGTLRLAIK